MPALENQVQQHEYEINAIKGAVLDSSAAVLECTKAMRELTTQFAIYTERHDNTEKSITAINLMVSDVVKLTNSNTIAIAAMSPTVESIRGLLWKMVASVVAGVGGASIIVVALIK
jgi:uncharacterized protein YoxC